MSLCKMNKYHTHVIRNRGYYSFRGFQGHFCIGNWKSLLSVLLIITPVRYANLRLLNIKKKNYAWFLVLHYVNTTNFFIVEIKPWFKANANQRLGCMFNLYLHQRPSNFCLMNASASASSPSAELNYAQFFPRLCLHMVQDMQANY